MNTFTKLVPSLFFIFTLTGCVNKLTFEPKKTVLNGFYSDIPVKIDGNLDDAVWQKAIEYELQLPADSIIGPRITDRGYVKFAWDKNFFYLAAIFKDKDVVAEGTENQLHHYNFGDVCELFLKPENSHHYWELYITPAGKKTTFFFPSKGYIGLPSVFNDYVFDLKVAAQVQGTLNNYHDVDTSWTCEMAVPLTELQKYDDKFGPGQLWRILVGRYNYSVYLNNKELSSLPRISQTDFHLHNEYGFLNLIRDPNILSNPKKQ